MSFTKSVIHCAHGASTMQSISDDIDSSLWWYIGLLGLYVWSFSLCLVGGARGATLEQFTVILAHKEDLICRCALPPLPPSYAEAMA